MELYVEQGYEQTTVADIAERAGVTARTFFRHFADKREVLFAGSAAAGGRAWSRRSPARRRTPRRWRPSGPRSTRPPRCSVATTRTRGAASPCIAANAELHERELIKMARLADALAAALVGPRGAGRPRRGWPPRRASRCSGSASSAGWPDRGRATRHRPARVARPAARAGRRSIAPHHPEHHRVDLRRGRNAERGRRPDDPDVVRPGPAAGSRCPALDEPPRQLPLHDQVGCDQPGARREQPGQDRARPGVGQVADHPESVPGQPEVGGVGAYDGEPRLACGQPVQRGQPARMQLDRHDAGAGRQQRPGQRAVCRRPRRGRGRGAHAAVGHDPASPAVSERVPAPRAAGGAVPAARTRRTNITQAGHVATIGSRGRAPQPVIGPARPARSASRSRG